MNDWAWTDERYIKVGDYWCSTDFEAFWELLKAGGPVIYCQHRELRFFSKTKLGFALYQHSAARKFKEKQIAFIDPRLYMLASQKLTPDDILCLDHPESVTFPDLFRLLHPDLYGKQPGEPCVILSS